MTLGITLNCPYGLGVCYADVHQNLEHLPGVSWVSDTADKQSWTCQIRMSDGRLLRPSALQKYLTSYRTGATVRGIEVTVLGRLDLQNGKPSLVVQGERMPLRALTDTVYWNAAGKKAGSIPASDRNAYVDLTLGASAGTRYVVTGFLKESSQGAMSLEVRSFRTPSQADLAANKPTGLFAPVPVLKSTVAQEIRPIQDAWPAKDGWSTVQPAPIPGVHAHLLPTGNIMFEAFADLTNESYSPSGTFSALQEPPYNVFCSGHGFMADGKIFFAGGRGTDPLSSTDGTGNAAIYDPFQNQWTALPSMGIHRWYPGVFLMANNQMLILSGSNVATDALEYVPQLWNGTGWVNLTGAKRLIPNYPSCYVAPDGRLFVAGPDNWSLYLDTRGAGSWEGAAQRTEGNRAYGPTVMYQPGKIFYVGGGSPPTVTSEIIDLNAKKPTWTAMASMHYARRFANATVLPDGTIFVNGGCYGPGIPFDDPTKPVYQSELWDPNTNTWTVTASQKEYRGYHSTALLMPDGRVYSSGGNDESNVEVYSPAYLSKGIRPIINSVPPVLISGTPFKMTYTTANGLSNISFIRIGSVTHTANVEQRFQYLTYSSSKLGLTVNAPTISALTPPGYYMVFVLDNQGIPSVGKIVLLSQGGTGTNQSPNAG